VLQDCPGAVVAVANSARILKMLTLGTIHYLQTRPSKEPARNEMIMPEQTLKGKVAVIGAGAKNLGGLISRTLGAEGAAVAVNYNSDSSRVSAEDTVVAIKKTGVCPTHLTSKIIYRG
jgi:hypothetical protein